MISCPSCSRSRNGGRGALLAPLAASPALRLCAAAPAAVRRRLRLLGTRLLALRSPAALAAHPPRYAVQVARPLLAQRGRQAGDNTRRFGSVFGRLAHLGRLALRRSRLRRASASGASAAAASNSSAGSSTSAAGSSAPPARCLPLPRARLRPRSAGSTSSADAASGTASSSASSPDPFSSGTAPRADPVYRATAPGSSLASSDSATEHHLDGLAPRHPARRRHRPRFASARRFRFVAASPWRVLGQRFAGKHEEIVVAGRG